MRGGPQGRTRPGSRDQQRYGARLGGGVVLRVPSARKTDGEWRRTPPELNTMRTANINEYFSVVSPLQLPHQAACEWRLQVRLKREDNLRYSHQPRPRVSVEEHRLTVDPERNAPHTACRPIRRYLADNKTNVCANMVKPKPPKGHHEIRTGTPPSEGDADTKADALRKMTETLANHSAQSTYSRAAIGSRQKDQHRSEGRKANASNKRVRKGNSMLAKQCDGVQHDGLHVGIAA
ncbi:hypothetical protein NDU88_006073 [Pleurodeles waltl]|uniref:Uncharacterized protein n=1 Tax=Pleurodeles waltl TaxID=8319 RepID=A0AAV7RKX4_PLEWA|nr:hypothetical protein NDU88_006073 [Pleurodeles waltl]